MERVPGGKRVELSDVVAPGDQHMLGWLHGPPGNRSKQYARVLRREDKRLVEQLLPHDQGCRRKMEPRGEYLLRFRAGCWKR